jgi:hypothetical protein
VFSGVESEMTSPRESRSVFSFLSGYKSEASTVVASNTTKAKGELDDTVALATFKASISPKASSAKLSKQETPPSASGKHSLFTFSEEDEGDLDEDDDDDSEMEPLVVASEQSRNAHEQQSINATADEPSPRSGTPINSDETMASGGTAAVAALAAMGLTSLLNSHSSSSDDSASTEEHHHTTAVVGAVTHNATTAATEPLRENKKTAPPPPPAASSPPKRSGFAAFFTLKKPDAVKTTPSAAAAAAKEPAVSPNSLKDRTSPPAPDKTGGFIKSASAPWGACSSKVTATIAPSPKPSEALPSSSVWAAVRATAHDESVESESLDDYSVQHSSDDEESTVPPRQSITSSEAAVYLETTKISPNDDDASELSTPVVYAQPAQAETSGGKTAGNSPGYESDPGTRSKSPKMASSNSNQTPTADNADDDVDNSSLEKVDLQWNNPLQASINAKTAREFVGWTTTTISDVDTTPTWKKTAREHAKAAFAESPNSPEFPSQADFESPGGRGKGRRHAKSTTADGSTDYQAETMQQRDESLATFDAVSLSDSESSDTRDETDTPQASPSMPLFSQEDHLVDHSMFSEDSRASSEASASRQLLSDLVWLEKKIAGVASSTASPMSEPKTKEKRQPSTIDHSDSLSFASGDGTCTSSLHEERKKLAGQAPSSALLPPEPPTTMSSIICRDCYAPPGKLRIVIHSTKDGPAVHTVKKESSLEGHVFPGDLIISVDNVDTRSYTAEQVMKMMTARTTYERKITVLHFDTTNLKS